MYTLDSPHFPAKPEPNRGLTGLKWQEKAAKTLQYAPKTGHFGGKRLHCYITATMGRKLSVYVKINVAARPFSRQLMHRKASPR
ncbi:hypothetical protein EJ069_05230 [Mesorhizobium sp. M2A.F.Ca.ET.043.05.1.1]|uniref:hypothetical protein n=1 Tax=Mesorhizobium sp. M2A.F.Ca.ET.043.05.1.1 TaxID=2493671 RepID=UPI000F75A463|nr:hypothetical protein [Mesorhizobium sp. M2A.F.Ca.ET.043.05.1.1]AZO14175.1 hypothetical protein EJ069_05230 [Mesorhizobium sp. M2A.F.Ca.ET.043.05.1.1]